MDTDIVVEGFDRHGMHHEWMLSGLRARVARHEIDHFNGILVIDYETLDGTPLHSLG